MRGRARMATNYFRLFHMAEKKCPYCPPGNLFPQPVSHLVPRCFPLPDHLGKIDGRRTTRFVIVNTLNANLTWLQHCRNLGHAKLSQPEVNCENGNERPP